MNATQRSHVVIGASGGIGSETCRRLRASGCNVLLAGRTEERLRALSQEIDAPYRTVDGSDVADVESCMEYALDQFGTVDGVVNCAGSVLLKPAHLTSPAEWQDTIAANLTSAFCTIRASFKVMRKSGGAIVLMSSAAAQTGLPNHEAIAAAKAGVVGLMRSAAATYASRGIRVNAVAPGLVT